jgi:2-furoyl-CoA dehydrogenase large subunit
VVKAPVPYYPFAIDKVRHVGEPVAVVVADDRNAFRSPSSQQRTSYAHIEFCRY